ncbi:hypothetical protein AURDEDRAFT_178612 [Auricularia subglabra TFB-10046 SS5]|uniref:Uncharacterized protein n=1 Tax=Auricularia subglabra (strain TFB-10046 / SS5) TaxID=717982 RepID=J0WJ64_AURST|nr:hypothetical protein AURDEDRAFT_178612 [Auricularia subglabra TFB-10046 SS5]
MACSFLLCEGCCGGLLLHCRVREHREHGQELYPGAPLDEVPPLRISNILCSDNVKIKITAVHAWLPNPQAWAGSSTLLYTLIPVPA